MLLNQAVFREYDVRGIADRDFSGDFALNLGKAFGTYVITDNKKRIAVSGDVRNSTSKLKKYARVGLGADIGWSCAFVFQEGNCCSKQIKPFTGP